MMSMERMKDELRQKYERLRKREEERRKTMLKYYEPLPEVAFLRWKESKRSNPDGDQEKEYTLIEQFEDQKKNLETMMKLVRKGVEKCDPKTLRGSLLAKSFIDGLEDMLLRLKNTVPEHIYKEAEEWVEKTDDELFDLAGKYGKMCYR